MLKLAHSQYYHSMALREEKKSSSHDTVVVDSILRYTAFASLLLRARPDETRLIASLAFRDHNFAEYLHILNFLLRLYEKNYYIHNNLCFLQVVEPHNERLSPPADSTDGLSYSQKNRLCIYNKKFNSKVFGVMSWIFKHVTTGIKVDVVARSSCNI